MKLSPVVVLLAVLLTGSLVLNAVFVSRAESRGPGAAGADSARDIAAATEVSPVALVANGAGQSRPRVTGALTAYAAVGSSLAANSRLRDVGWNDAQVEAFLEGVRAAIRDEGYPLDESAKRAFTEMSRSVAVIDAKRREHEFEQPGRLDQYMKEICERMHLQRSDSGLAFAMMDGGKGIRPSPEDVVVVSMAATADDTTSPIPKLTAERMRVNVADLMPGLSEGVQLMTIGAKAMFVIPPALSYGERSWPEGAVRGAPVIVIMTLHEVISPPVDP